MATITDAVGIDASQPELVGDTSFYGHPRGLRLLFGVEMWERVSYYGMRSILVLYLVNALKWSVGDAANLYGTYTALVYLTPLIGGYLADRYIGTRRSLLIGGIIIAMGHFALAFPGISMFYAGLGLIIIGTGFFKPNVSTMVGQLYKDGDKRRDAGFTIFYMGVNLGAFLAPFLCGTLAQKVGWHYGFAAAGVGMVIGLVLYMYGVDKYLPGIGLKPTNETRAAMAAISGETEGKLVHAVLGALVGVALFWLGSNLSYANGGMAWNGSVLSPLALAMGAIIGGALGYSVLGTHGEERKRVLAIFILVFFVIFFWMAFEQAGSSMTLFADKFTNNRVFGFEFPSSWYQAVNPLFIIGFAPLFAAMWVRLGTTGKEPPTALKMVFGLAMVGLGFLFLVAAGHSVDAGNKVSPFWLIMAYLFHTWGELCLSPVGLSYVSKVAPARLASLLMGVWFLANAAANKLGGTLAAMTENIHSQATFFTIPVATSLGAAVLLLLLVPLLRRLTASVHA
ncbi:MAG TPA: peptide MFS transporter [Longimicrobiaceae bacterium]|nr:peptide MFS transporter [Longimicrobiaceae bacterium]